VLSARRWRKRPRRIVADSTALPWDPGIAIGEFRADPRYKCLFVAFAASWCGACEDEQMTLSKTVTADPGFGVYGLLVEGPDHDSHGNFPVARRNVDDWTQMFKQNFPVVMGDDATHGLLNGWNMAGQETFPFSMVVKPSTMEIVDAYFGGLTDDGYNSALTKCGAGP